MRLRKVEWFPFCVLDFLQERCRTTTRKKTRELERVGIFFGKTVLSTMYPIKNSKSEGGIPLNVWFIA